MPLWRSPEEKALWKQSIKRYAEHPNVAIKLSGFGVFNPEWNAASIDPILSEVIAAFTPGRCMFATNFPVEGIFKGYREVWNTSRFLSDFRPTNRAHVLAQCGTPLSTEPLRLKDLCVLCRLLSSFDFRFDASPRTTIAQSGARDRRVGAGAVPIPIHSAGFGQLGKQFVVDNVGGAEASSAGNACQGRARWLYADRPRHGVAITAAWQKSLPYDPSSAIS